MSRSDLYHEFVDMLGTSFRPILTQPQPSRPQSQPKNSGNKVNIDIVNEDKFMYVYAELPSVPKENIDVSFYNNKITIFAEKTRPYDLPEMSEIKYGKYERTITLPFCITKKESVSLNFNNGMLKIKINKELEEENKFCLKLD
jgi:HSP20 family molecular chaperone IbpA